MNNPENITTLIKCKSLTKTFDSGDSKLNILSDISLEIKTGTKVSLLGPSGAGKSTLLYILGGLESPTLGEIFYKDKSYNKMKKSEIDFVRNKEFGFVFQFYHLVPELNVLENVLLPLTIKTSLLKWTIKSNDFKSQAEELLIKVGLKERINHKVTRLSGGEKQRVAIARALVTNPQILFCDEPTGNLDSKTSISIKELLWQIAEEENMTLFLVTHNKELAHSADISYKLIDGKLGVTV